MPSSQNNHYNKGDNYPLNQFSDGRYVNTQGLDPFADCPDIQKLRCLQADVCYFLTVFGEKEAVELSNIDNPTSNVINTKRIEFALQDAFAYIINTYTAASAGARVLIQSSLRRTQAIIARYYLDTLSPRDHVVEQYQQVLEQLQIWSSTGSAQSLNKFDQAYRFYKDQPYSQGVSLISSSYENNRKFTAASLEGYVEGCWSNDTSQYVRWDDIKINVEYDVARGPGAGISPSGTKLPEQVQAVNELYDNLDQTLMLGNFEETKSESKRTAQEGDVAKLNPDTDDPNTPLVDEDIIEPDSPYNLTF